MLDTLEVILDSPESTPFVQLSETVLSASQWEALEFWLQIDTPEDEQLGRSDVPNTLVIMCDLPLISQRGESGELMQMWEQGLRVKRIQPILATALT